MTAICSPRTGMITFRALILIGCVNCSLPFAAAQERSQQYVLESPDGLLQLSLRLDERGRPVFEVKYRDAPIVAGSMGLEFSGSGLLGEKLRILGERRNNRDETYVVPVGKTSQARDHHHELILALEEATSPHRRLELVFRAFNDGVAFRYRVPEQDGLGAFVLTDEMTRLSFPGAAQEEPTARLLPLRNYTTSYEWYYQTRKVSEIPGDQLVGLPILMHRPLSEGTVWIAFTEADLTDYAGMYLTGVLETPGTLACRLSPLPGRTDGAKVLGQTPMETPWRVLMIADDPGRLIESNIIFNLNDPCRIADTSWIKPGKTTFPWWNAYVLPDVDFEPGVNTATMKHYIDFCAEQGIPYHSLDGLDIAWYGGPIRPSGPTNVTRAAPSIDLPAVLRHAKEKGVRLRLWMHWKALEPQIDEAFRQYEEWGIEGVMVDFMDRDDQDMVRFYHEMAEKAARHHLTVTLHGAYKPTGMERTWPNVLTYEAVLNQEFNKWAPAGVKGTPPEHNLDVAFVRLLAGPLDYHHGGMRNVLPEHYRFRNEAPPVQGTRGHQLAMYIVYQDHLPMMADYPAAYRGQPELKFLVDIPTTWDETRVLHAQFGNCIVIARRRGTDWYLGGMTSNAGKELSLPLNFLGDGRFEAEMYVDIPGNDPTRVIRRTQEISATASLDVVMPRAGGFAGRVRRSMR